MRQETERESGGGGERESGGGGWQVAVDVDEKTSDGMWHIACVNG